MKVLQGIIHGRTIELDDDPGVDNGSAVEVMIQMQHLSGPRRGWNTSLAETPLISWSEEDDRIFEEIHTVRKAALERKVPE